LNDRIRRAIVHLTAINAWGTLLGACSQALTRFGRWIQSSLEEYQHSMGSISILLRSMQGNKCTSLGESFKPFALEQAIREDESELVEVGTSDHLGPETCSAQHPSSYSHVMTMSHLDRTALVVVSHPDDASFPLPSRGSPSPLYGILDFPPIFAICMQTTSTL